MAKAPPNTLQINLGAKDSPVLSAFMADRESWVSFIMGPLGSNKTYGCLQRLMAQMTEQEPNRDGVRPTRWAVVRNTYVDLANTTIKDFQEVFTQPHFGRMRWGPGSPEFKVQVKLPDGTLVKAEFIFLALDNADDIKKLRGTQFTGFWFNEVKELIKAIIDMADLRHGRYPSMVSGGVDCTWHGMMGDTNACDEDHWYYRLAEEATPKGWKFYRQPAGVLPTEAKDRLGNTVWRENPLAEGVRIPGYYTRGMEGKDPDWISVNLGNNYGFLVDGKPVHPNYNDSVHHIDAMHPDIKITQLKVGIDFGRTPAATMVYVDPVFGTYICIDEFVTDDMSASIFGTELKRYLDKTYPGVAIQAWCDPAGEHPGEQVEDTAIDLIRAAGIFVQPAPSQNIEMRRGAVTNPLRRLGADGRPGLLICSKAKITRKGLMGGFAYRRLAIKGTERFSEEPNKDMYSHPVESLEYVLLGCGERTLALKSPQSERAARGRPRRVARAAKTTRGMGRRFEMSKGD